MDCEPPADELRALICRRQHGGGRLRAQEDDDCIAPVIRPPRVRRALLASRNAVELCGGTGRILAPH
eukprot:2577098-Lingulodinium_polyedra.AAC.1